MKKILLTSIVCAVIICMGQTAQAQDQGFGIGAILNDPTGISLKGWINEDFAIDGATTFRIGQNYTEFYLHADAIQHSDPENENFNLQNGDLRFYYGLGMRLIWTDVGNDIFAGIRTPVGTTYLFEDAPVDAFFELAPTIDFNPNFRFSFAGALGVRYYLD